MFTVPLVVTPGVFTPTIRIFPVGSTLPGAYMVSVFLCPLPVVFVCRLHTNIASAAVIAITTFAVLEIMQNTGGAAPTAHLKNR
jgi:hypothetical protein